MFYRVLAFVPFFVNFSNTEQSSYIVLFKHKRKNGGDRSNHRIPGFVTMNRWWFLNNDFKHKNSYYLLVSKYQFYFVEDKPTERKTPNIL